MSGRDIAVSGDYKGGKPQRKRRFFVLFVLVFIMQYLLGSSGKGGDGVRRKGRHLIFPTPSCPLPPHLHGLLEYRGPKCLFVLIFFQV